MTDLFIDNVADAHVHEGRRSLNAGDTKWVYVHSGKHRAFIKPHLVNILGRTVLDARLVGRVGPDHQGQTYTLTPVTEKWTAGRVTWNNQPAHNAAAGVVVTVPALPDAGIVEFPVTAHLQAVADGTPWYGWRLTTDSVATGQRFYATDSGEPAWELHVTLSDAPEQPTNLRPDGGAVSTDKPILAWDFIDYGGESTVQVASRVMVDTPAAGAEPDDVAPDYDSGWVTNPEPQFDLAGATSTYVPPTAPPGATYWRVIVRDGDGNESEWSDWADYTVVPLPVLVIDSPTGAVGDPAVEVLAHLTGGTIETWRVRATGRDRSDIRAGSGMRTGAVSWEAPVRNSKHRRVFVEPDDGGIAGWLHVRVWDDVDRAVAVGEQPYVETWIAVDFTEDSLQVKPTGLTVTPRAVGDPRSTWSWSSTDTADAWLLQVDDVTVRRVSADDVAPVAGVYTWDDDGEVPPLRARKLGVRAVRNKAASGAATIVGHVSVVEGVWLLPDALDRAIVLNGTAVSGFATSDQVATYEPMGGDPVDIVYGWTGRIGSFEGTIDNRQNVWADVDAIDKLRTKRNRLARLVWGSQSIMVRVRNPDVTSSDEILPDNLEHVVRFDFIEVGD